MSCVEFVRIRGVLERVCDGETQTQRGAFGLKAQMGLGWFGPAEKERKEIL